MNKNVLYQLIITALVFAAVCACLMAVVPAARAAFGIFAIVLSAVFTACIAKITVFSK